MASTYATDIYPGTGSETEFDLTFEFISRDHVGVAVINDSDGAETILTVIETGEPVGNEYRWENDTRIKVGTAPAADQKIRIRRDTPENQQLVPWADGSYLLSEDLNTSDLQWLYGLQELEDKFGLLQTTAIKYLGAIDLTVDEAPVGPTGGDFYINTGTGSVLASWIGIGGDAVVGSEQVVYNSVSAEWQIFAVPSTQQGVLQVTGASPIAIDNTDTQRPDVSITPATASAAGSMSAADKTKLDGVEDGAQANVNADWDATSGVAEILNKPDVIDGDAPSDGKTYGRKDSAWSEVEPGGVTQIVAGNNVTISPSTGTGVVTVNSTGGGGGGSGVSSIIAGAGISVNQSTGDVTITNTGGGGGGGGGETKADIYGTAKAWGSFDGTGSNAEFSSFNIESFTRSAAGIYDVVFTTPMPTNEYAVTGNYTSWANEENKTTTGFTLYTYATGAAGTLADLNTVDFTVHDNTPAEIIVGSGTVANTNLYGTAKAWGDVATDGTLTNGLGCSVTRTQAGYYTVTFNTPRTDNDYSVVTAAIEGFAGFSIAPQNYTNTGFQIRCLNNAAATTTWADAKFNFAVFDNEPAEVALTTFGDVINYSGASAWGDVASDGTLNGGLNVASVTQSPAGTYTVVFTTPMPSSDYSIVFGGTALNSTVSAPGSDKTVTGFVYKSYSLTSSNLASIAANFAVFATNALPPKGGTGTDSWGSVQSDGTLDASFNVASVTRTGTGTYDVVFTTPMPSSNYVVTTAIYGGSSFGTALFSAKSTTGFTIKTGYITNTNIPLDYSFDFTVNATNATLPLTVTQEQIESAINNPGASAWANFEADGTINAGLNVASVTRVSAGKYDVVLATPMPDSFYSVTLGGRAAGVRSQSQTPTGFRIETFNAGGSLSDLETNFTVFATNNLPPKGGTGTDAWASFDCNPAKLNSSFNVSSITRTGVGIYEFVFTTPMPTVDYAVVLGNNTAGAFLQQSVFKNVNGFTVRNFNASTLAQQDAVELSFAVNATNATLPATLTQDMLVMKSETYAVNVKDFGAVGDGVADDTAAIQAALDTQRNIYLPKGSYKISNSLKTTINGQHITGENRDKTYLRSTPSTDYDLLRILHNQIDVSGIIFRPGTDGDPTASPASWACLRITSSWATVHDCRFLSGSDGEGVGIFLDDVNPETGATVAGAYIHTIQNNLIGYTGYAFKQAVYSLCLTNGQQATRFLNNTIWGNVGIQILKGGGNVYGNNLLQSATGTYDVGVGNGFDFSENVSGETCYGNYIERYDYAVILRATASSPSVWRGDYFGNHFDNNNENIFSSGTTSFSFWDYVNKTQLINGIKYIYDSDGYDATRSDGVVALRVDTTKGSVEPRRLIFSDTTTLGYTTNNQTLFANTVYNKISGAGASRTGCSLGTGVAEGQLIILYGNSWPVQILNTNAIFSNSESSVTFGNSAGQIVAMQLIWNGGSWVELSRNSV